MSDVDIGDVFEDSFSIENEQSAYVLTEFGDGHYLGEPVAVFTSKEAATIFKECQDRALVMVEANIFTTDKDGYIPQSRTIKKENRARRIAVDHIDTDDEFQGCGLAQLIKNEDISPEEMRQNKIEVVAEQLFVSSGEVPDEWEEEVENYAEEYYG